jgi:hypothetical protein
MTLMDRVCLRLVPRRARHGVALLVMLLAGAWLLGPESSRAGAAPEWSVTDLEGHLVDPLAGQAKGTVFVFVRPDCPISNRYAPQVAGLHMRFAGQGINFKLVYTDAGLTTDEVRRHLKEFGYPGTALRDPEHQLVARCRARVTPEAAVMTADGELVYHGRIDDRYLALGRWKREASRHDLELALQALVDHQPFPPSQPGVGCAITPLKSE